MGLGSGLCQAHTAWVRVRLLGPVSAEVDGVRLRLGSRKQRAVFALLALQVNSPVALDRLVDELWHDEPPAQATLSLQSYISRLRRMISDAQPADRPGEEPEDRSTPRILTRPPGWALMMPAEDVDAVRFVELAHEGSSLLEEAEVATGAARLREALALWTGETLADLDDLPFAVGGEGPAAGPAGLDHRVPAVGRAGPRDELPRWRQWLVRRFPRTPTASTRGAR